MSNEVIVKQAGTDMIMNVGIFEQAQRGAKLLSSSNLVPSHFQGEKNMANCFLGLMVAHRMQEDPLMVLQNMYVVNGKPGWSTQYMIARANHSGVFKGRITWSIEGNGDDLVVTAKAILADTGEEVSASASMEMAKAEGWTKNAKYKSMPEHMLRWRSAAMLIRLYAPEVMMGYQTQEELETLPAEPKDVTPKETINRAIKATKKEKDASQAEKEEKDAIEEAVNRIESAAAEARATDTNEHAHEPDHPYDRAKRMIGLMGTMAPEDASRHYHENGGEALERELVTNALGKLASELRAAAGA